MRELSRWIVRDRDGNDIYLTDDHSQHICDHHPEMESYEAQLRETIPSGKRRQDALNPQNYRYLSRFSKLPEDNTHMEAVVLFRLGESIDGEPLVNNYVVTAYQKQTR